MAFDAFLVERIQRTLNDKKIVFYNKKMMGGMVFFVDDKMLCGTHIDKKYGDSLIMVRIGEEAYLKYINKPECLPMDFTGKPMKGYAFITPEGFDLDKDLDFWIDQTLQFNSLAKSSKKRKK